MRTKSGFTILELLVVIVIIGLISAAGMVLFSAARLKGRDARRIQDVKQIQNALGLYAADNNGRFPNQTVDPLTGTDAVSLLLVPNRIPAMPRDPQHAVGGNRYYYTAVGNGNSYILNFCLEGTSIRGYSQGCVNSVTP